jgi:hypothetical protein
VLFIAAAGFLVASCGSGGLENFFGDICGGAPCPVVATCDAADPPLATETFGWTLSGFSSADLANPDDAGPDFTVVLRLGERRVLRLSTFHGDETDDCTGRLASVEWSSSEPHARFSETSTTSAVLTGVSRGDTMVLAQLTFKSGGEFRAFPVVSGRATSALVRTVRVRK